MKSSLRSFLERARHSGADILPRSLDVLEIDQVDLSARIHNMMKSIDSDEHGERVQAAVILLGWGATLGYYYAMKKTKGQIVNVKDAIDRL